jgi:Tol biopolymer transport system component
VVLLPVLFFTGCSDNTADPGNNGINPTGTLYITGQYDLFSASVSSGTVTNFIEGARMPYATQEGTIIMNKGDHTDLEEYNPQTKTSRVIVKANLNDAATYNDDFLNPQVSNDGKYIAYEGTPLQNAAGTYPVYVIDRASGQLIGSYFDMSAYLDGYLRPTWTPDNRIVVAGAKQGLFITNKELTTFTRIDANISNKILQPAVSPDGTKIAFILDNHLYTINPDGSGMKQLTTSTFGERWPHWSADGKLIAVMGSDDVYFIKADGSGFAALSDYVNKPGTSSYLVGVYSGQFAWR